MSVRTCISNVPKGFEALIPFLRESRDFREHFFSRLKMFYYAGAGLLQPVWDELDRLAVDTCGERIMMFTGLGSTKPGPQRCSRQVPAARRRRGPARTPAWN